MRGPEFLCIRMKLYGIMSVWGGVEDEEYYATLLSESKSTGPASVYDGSYAFYQEGDEEYEIWKRFVEYQDSDGFYFLQEFWVECHPCINTSSLRLRTEENEMEIRIAVMEELAAIAEVEKLIPFYETFGFINEGVSASVHGGAVWYDMRLRFS